MNPLSVISGYTWTPAAILTGLESLVLFAAGIWIAQQRARSSPALRRFLALVLISAATLGAMAMSHAASSDDAAHSWVRLVLLLCPWIPLFLFALMATARAASRIPLPAIFGAAALSIMGFRSSFVSNGFLEQWWGSYPKASLTAALLPAYWAVLVALGAVLLVTQWPSAPGAESRRFRELRLVLIAGGFALLDFVAAFGLPLPPVGSMVFVAVVARVTWNPKARESLFPVTIEMAAERVLEAMADAVVVVDVEGRIVVVNHALESMLGYSAGELRGEPVTKLLYDHTEDTSRSDRIRAVLHGRTIRDIERVFRTSKGDAIPVSLSMSALEGDEDGIVLVVRDIRERKAAEAEIRRTASLLRSILDSTHDAILVVGRDGRLLDWNRRFVELFEIDAAPANTDEPSGVLEATLAKLRNSDVFAEAIMKAGAGDGVSLPVMIEMKDGRILECASIPHRPDGETAGRVWSLADVTERRRAEQALRTSELRYRLLFERNAAGVYRALLDGTIVDCNDAYARLFGYTRATDLIGSNVLAFFFDPDERATLVSMLGDVGSLTGIELRLKHRDGREIWVMENVALVESLETGFAIEGTVVDISSLKIAEEQMEFQAYHDVLTLLPNRRLFIDRLTLSLAHARRTRASLAVMFLDLDHFKNVNDTLGHTAGDELLLVIAERLGQAVREEDTVARIGGDEFTILTAGLREPQDAIVVAEKILVSIARPIEAAGTVLHVTASLGIAFYPDDGDEPEALLKSSDSALYRAKELGRNGYQLCTPQLKVRAIERVTMESELRESINRGDMVLHYQPVVRLDTGEITSVEALVRWNHPRRGLVMPAAFMGVAESTRLCLGLDMWVLEEACRQLGAWIDAGFGHLRVSVNLSGHHLQQRDLPQKVETILSECGVAPDRVELELTENAILDAREVGLPLLRELREMGVAISMDDFGTGFTSLSYLRHLPLDVVKIDRSMVANLPLNAGDAAVVSSIVNLARLMNLRVIAEGVETTEQVRLLRERKCNEVQGHLFSAALPAELMGEILRQSGSASPAIDVKRILRAKA